MMSRGWWSERRAMLATMAAVAVASGSQRERAVGRGRGAHRKEKTGDVREREEEG